MGGAYSTQMFRASGTDRHFCLFVFEAIFPTHDPPASAPSGLGLQVGATAGSQTLFVGPRDMERTEQKGRHPEFRDQPLPPAGQMQTSAQSHVNWQL